jgi:FkbM family methyltransferase
MAAASVWPFPVAVRLSDGDAIFADLRSSIGKGLLATGAFDYKAIEPILQALGAGDIFVDVGANIGYYSFLASKKVGVNGRVFAFEMDRRPIRCLERTISYHRLRNIEIINSAVWHEDTQCIFTPRGEHGHNQVDAGGRGTIRVPGVKLDTVFMNRPKDTVRAIKFDIEGAELNALRGARNLIARDRPLITCESTSSSASFGYGTDDLLAFFRELHYTTRWLSGVHTPTIMASPI